MSDKLGKIIYDNAGKTSYEKGIINNIIRLSCLQIHGVAALTRGNSSGIKKTLTRKYQDGVLVEKESGGLFIDVYINVYYGTKVPEVAYKIQHNIKESVESATDYKVGRVNVHVTGVIFKKEEPKQTDIPNYGL